MITYKFKCILLHGSNRSDDLNFKTVLWEYEWYSIHSGSYVDGRNTQINPDHSSQLDYNTNDKILPYKAKLEVN